MAIRFYDTPKSGHCHRVRLAASLMGVALDLVQVSEMEGQRQGKEYLALNPFGQVPTLVDDGVKVRDSIAIIQYLERTYAPDKGWMPKEPRERAETDEWFAITSGAMFRGPNMARLIKLFKLDGNYEAAVQMSLKLFEFMDTHLQGRDWLVGSRSTLADIACYSYIAVANEGELDISPYRNIQAWLVAIQKLDGFIDIPRSPSDD